MSSIKERIEAYKLEHGISSNVPPDKDIIQSIDLKEDITTVVDKDGNELCRFYIEIEGRKLFFKFPTWDKYELYQKKFAELAIYLSQCVTAVEITPSNVELFKNPIAKSLWQESAGHAVAGSRRVRELIIDIFFNTLDAYVEGITIQKKRWESKKRFNEKYEDRFTLAQLDWFKKHIRIDKLQHILYCCFAVDELIKKNATLGIVKRSPHLLSQEQNSKNTSAQKPESIPKNSEVIQFSTLKQL